VKKKTRGYLCDTCGKNRAGAHTDVLKDETGARKWSTSVCPECFAGGKQQRYTFEMHMDSIGNHEYITAKCPVHGPIKMLQAPPVDPRFQSNYIRWRTGGAMVAPPKTTKWV
jgi:hypothetical protein